MTPETSIILREQMLRDGYCIIPNILSPEFLQELRKESDRLNDTLPHHPDTKYQGTHLGIGYNDNEIMLKLSEWKPARQALELMGFGDFNPGGSLLILTKEPYAPALYWHGIKIGCGGTTPSAVHLGHRRFFYLTTLKTRMLKMVV